MKQTRSLSSVSAIIFGLLPPAAPAAVTIRPEHPRLLLNREDLGAIRVRCGVQGYEADPIARARGITFGSQRDLLDRLWAIGETIMKDSPRPDDLYAPAFLHLITGEFDRPDKYTAYVADALLDVSLPRYGLDAIVALDFCWDAIRPDDRARIADRLGGAMEPLRPEQNPLDHFSFARRVSDLAAAIVLHDPRGRDSGETAGRVTAVLAGADVYLNGPFLEVCRQRGAMPAASGHGAWEEANLVLAVELWRSATGESLWPRLVDSLGRAMEPYFYADTDSPALDHGFIHDDGSHMPLRPGEIDQGFIPAVPWAIARHTRDPIAAWYAARSFALTGGSMALERERYRWVPILYGPLDMPEAARRACPLGRDFGGGWVAMRSGWSGGDTVLLFDAGQPYWRSRQHFDAGAFQVYRKGRLAIDSGDDVTYEAVAAKGGRTTIGGQRGDWDQYAHATIAHNCITVADRRYVAELYGRPWLAMGNQRPIGHDYQPSSGDLATTGRVTGRLAAFETNSFYSYAAADVTPAYAEELAQVVRRRILFINAGAVLVLDDVIGTRITSIKTWHLQLPARPRIDGGDLTTAPQRHGVDQMAGIWEMKPDQQWLDVTQGDGRLFVRTLLPAGTHRHVVGGPMRPMIIPEGEFAGRTYYGGDEFGYEHRLWPASFLRAPNVAYELGKPTNLGPQFGVGANWGRLDVSPAGKVQKVTFLHVLIPTDATVETPPPMSFEAHDTLVVVDLDLRSQQAHLELSIAGEHAGTVRLTDRSTGKVAFEKTLAATVEPNREIPGAATAIP